MAPLGTRSGRRIAAGAYDLIRELALRPGPALAPAQIHREVLRRHGGADAPSLRTVQRLVGELRPVDESGQWSLLGHVGDGAENVLRLVAVLDRRPTKAQAASYLQIMAAAPDIEPLRAYVLVLMSDRDVLYLEEYLAFAPWRDSAAALVAAVVRGRVPRDVLPMHDMLNRVTNYSDEEADDAG